MSIPIFRDPIEDGAADPTVIRREGTDEWWMFYTNRRPTTTGPKFSWIHGSLIGIAVSSDDGASWQYRGTVAGLDDPADEAGGNTLWAPEVIFAEGQYHMYLSYIPGIPSNFPGVPRTIVHFTSPDLITWTRIGPLVLNGPRVIDACVHRCPDGLWRMWYKDEDAGSSTWTATSPDLFNWTQEGLLLAGKPEGAPHEGPNVFELGGYFWLITDEWHGLAVYRSTDALDWTKTGVVGREPGNDSSDTRYVRHADVVVNGDHAALYYFTHPEWDELNPAEGPITGNAKRTAIHHARLTVSNGQLIFERNIPRDQPLLRDG